MLLKDDENISGKDKKLLQMVFYDETVLDRQRYEWAFTRPSAIVEECKPTRCGACGACG